ncbi:D-arabitol-phosphate dehydrogenase [subsurface metagenome]|jgi:L-iditol 2-dehydrogenase
MKAIVKTGRGKGLVEIREVPTPEINYSEVLIKVHYSGICGTDIHIWNDEFPYYPPVTLGHEFSGEIVKLGKDVDRWKIGDKVVSELHTGACGVCRFCRTSNYQACKFKRAPGWGINGSFTEYIKMPSWLLHKIPDGVSMKEAAIMEPAAIAAQAIYKANVKTGDFVIIFGPGPIGLICAKMAMITGANRVAIVGKEIDNKIRLPLSKKLGVDYVINIDKEADLENFIKDLTNGEGADVVIEATGSELAINEAFKIMRWNGRMAVVGLPNKTRLSINWSIAALKALDIRFSFSSKYLDWERTLQLLKKRKLNLKTLITHEFPLNEWKKAFKVIVEGKAIKVLLKSIN